MSEFVGMVAQFDSEVTSVIREAAHWARAWHTPTITTAHLAAALASLQLTPPRWGMTNDSVELLRRDAGPKSGAADRPGMSSDTDDALRTAGLVGGGVPITTAPLRYAVLRVHGPARAVLRAVAPWPSEADDLAPGHVLTHARERQLGRALPRSVLRIVGDLRFEASTESMWRVVYEPGLATDENTVSVEVLDGPRGLGERRRTVRDTKRGRQVEESLVIAYAEGRSMTFETTVNGRSYAVATEVTPSGLDAVVRIEIAAEVDALERLAYEYRADDVIAEARGSLERGLERLRHGHRVAGA